LRARRKDLSLGLFERFNLQCNSNLVIRYFRPNSDAEGRHVHSNPLKEIPTITDAYYWSFFLRSIRQWNNVTKYSSKMLEIPFNNDV